MTEQESAESPTRKPIQIALAIYQGVGLVALCDDGTMWWIERPYDPLGESPSCDWIQIKDIPQIYTGKSK